MKLWIARDVNGDLWFHVVKFNSAGMVNNKVIYSLDKDLFPEISFKNSPKRVKIELI